MLTVHKADHQGRRITSYPAWLLYAGAAEVVALAHWRGTSVETPFVTFAQGDFLIETFYLHRPYNVFALYDGGLLPADIDLGEYVERIRGAGRLEDEGRGLFARLCARLPAPCLLKGQYVNFTFPAEFDPDRQELTWRDVALDLWVPAQGHPLLLDADEYALLDLETSHPALHQSVQQSLRQLWAHASQRTGPFAPPVALAT